MSVPPLPIAISSQWQDCSAIARYLNTALALIPPLQVTGQPPQLQIHLPAFHVRSLGKLLPQLHSALKALPGPKYWDIHVYVDEDAAENRLVHCELIEKSPADVVLPTLPVLSPVPTATAPPKAKIIPKRPSKAWRSHLKARRKTVRQRRLIASGVVLTGASFLLGTLTSWAVSVGQSLLATSPSSELTADKSLPPLEPALEPGVVPDVAGETVPTAAPPPPTNNSLVQPIAPPEGFTVAASSLTVPTAAQVAVQLKAMGDIIPGTDFPNYRLPTDPNYLFNSVKMFMGEVDIVFGNFESTLTDYPYTAKDVGQGMTFAFRTPPNWTDVLKSAGFDVLSVANNHSFDFGDPGFDDTIANIQQSGMQAVGRKDQIVTVDANGYQVAFIGFSYWPDHNDMNDLATATALVQEAQAAADMVVISVHAGAEGTDVLRVRNQTEYFFSENRGNMVQFSHAMIDAGADLVLGHGPHVPRAIELYQDKLIAYSLGNFLGYRTLSTAGPLGLSMILQVEMNEAGDFLKGRVIPVALDRNGVPYIDDAFASVTLVRQLTQQDFPDTPLTIDQMGYILRTDSP